MSSAAAAPTLQPRAGEASGSSPRPQSHKRSHKKLIFFIVFFAVTAFVTFMKNKDILNPASDIAKHFAPGTMFLIPHAIFATLALVMGAFQFSTRLRTRYLQVHRVMGYIYIVSVMVGAPFAIPLAVRVAIGSPSLVAASAAQSFGWMLCTAIALYCVRNGNIREHRKWMLRGYPFALVFTASRMIIPIPPILRSGPKGVEVVVWCLIFLAAFLPSVIMEWQAIKPPARAKAVAAD